MPKHTMTAEEARQLFSYNPETGDLAWRINRGRIRAGTLIRAPSVQGYYQVMYRNRNYRAHRVAWLIYYGEWPLLELDHINGIRNDNRIANLREAYHSENCRNGRLRSTNSSGFKGVSWHKASGKWHAQITVDGTTRHLGLHKTAEEAHAAYRKAAAEHHGEFANFG